MDTTSFTILEYDLIKAHVSEYCVSNLGKALCESLRPSSDLGRVKVMPQETTEARSLAKGGAQPISGLHDVNEPLTLAEKAQVLAPKDLLRIADTLRGAAKFKKFMRGKPVSSASLKDAVQEGFVTQKNGRYVIPVRASHKARVPGSVIAASASGQTVFIEPASVQNLVSDLVTLRAQEEDLIYRVLCELTALVLAEMPAIKVTVETMAACDFAMAKGRYSLDVEGVEPRMTTGSTVNLTQVRHPLLGKGAVPVDVTVGGAYRTLVVTGPNTGGKTVLLKTVGLSCLMAQSGLHIPAASAELPLFSEVLADIGDNQSIQQSLSTFSSHMSAIAGSSARPGRVRWRSWTR